MGSFEKEFDNIKNSSNPEIINDFLIRISEDPEQEYLNFLNHFLNKTEEMIFEKIKLNMIYSLGEIGKVAEIPNEYLKKLIHIYYTSDRWIRYEIIQTISKISIHTKLDEDINKLLGIALNDDYFPVKKSVLKLLKGFEILPNSILVHFFRVLNVKESEIIDLCGQVFERLALNSDTIYKFLDSSDNYKILKSRGIRSLLLLKFNSILNLETFRGLIINAKWETRSKEQYLKEIDIMQSILLKNL